MSQIVYRTFHKKIEAREFPHENDYAMTGVRWGRTDKLFTPAFWAAQAWLMEPACDLAQCQLGDTLEEEVAGCLLGGHGISAEVGLAAFTKVKKSGVLKKNPCSYNDFHAILTRPMLVNGRKIRYRFPRTKSKYLAQSITILRRGIPPHKTNREFRDWIAGLPGIGLKTASWITRNWWRSDEVAILDIHVLRAGRIAGIFDTDRVTPRTYRALESRFLDFASVVAVRASVLDVLIWNTMRNLPVLPQKMLDQIKGDRTNNEAA